MDEKDASASSEEELTNVIAQLTASNKCAAFWNDRIALQNRFSNREKGWQVEVEWKSSAFGVGLFACENVCAGTLLRVGKIGSNLMEFTCIEDVEQFLTPSSDQEEYKAKLNYFSDYTYGLSRRKNDSNDRFIGMWVPGFGLNHHTSPNVVQRTDDLGCIHLYALMDIKKGEEMFEDYRLFGSAPEWLRDFASNHNIRLTFQNCNDYVGD